MDTKQSTSARFVISVQSNQLDSWSWQYWLLFPAWLRPYPFGHFH